MRTVPTEYRGETTVGKQRTYQVFKQEIDDTVAGSR